MAKLGILNTGKGFEPEKITHDHKCENCGEPATMNYQLVWVSWTIKPDGKIENQKFRQCHENEFWCSRCWELDRNEKIGELNKIWDEWKNAKVSKL